MRSYYSATISNFIAENESSILGCLHDSNEHENVKLLQTKAWVEQIKILKKQLNGLNGHIYFEFTIPRMGKRADNIIIIGDTIFVVEFKVGDSIHNKYAQEQVIDYTLDLKNFHEGSHHQKLIPILVATAAPNVDHDLSSIKDLKQAGKANSDNLATLLQQFIGNQSAIVASTWEKSVYKPTPTIVEAAQALYKGHSVENISRSDAGAINLSKTTDCLDKIIDKAKAEYKKAICFVTGVPGAGKTLAGLNIANKRRQQAKSDETEHAVFLSGNGPLVDVLREALARDLVDNQRREEKKITKKEALRRSSTFIQNIHHFRDEYLENENAPTEQIVVFDEAQRAWDKDQASSFMKRKKGNDNFDKSEPEFLIDVMNRHTKWCVIVCLIGGGQEINTGEAGLEEWVNALTKKYQSWEVYYSNLIVDSKNYIRPVEPGKQEKEQDQKRWLLNNAYCEKSLHLAVSVRSFRSEKLSEFVHELLDLNIDNAKRLYEQINNDFPIFITRSLSVAKDHVKNQVKGSERSGIVASSGARRLRAFGLDVKNEIAAPNWFLNVCIQKLKA
jgi:hypothetical protein